MTVEAGVARSPPQSRRFRRYRRDFLDSRWRPWGSRVFAADRPGCAVAQMISAAEPLDGPKLGILDAGSARRHERRRREPLARTPDDQGRRHAGARSLRRFGVSLVVARYRHRSRGCCSGHAGPVRRSGGRPTP